MKRRTRLPASGIIVVVLGACLNACAGGGSSSPVVASPVVTSPVGQAGTSPVAPAAATSHGTITIRIPTKTRARSRSLRPEYVSSGTTHAAVFIDGATSPAGSTTTCPSGACTITWSAGISVPASHSFAVEIDNGTTVLAENKALYAIIAGSNTLTALTLNGVATNATFTGEACQNTNCIGTVTIADAAGKPITNSGTNPSFDNGSVTLATTNGNGAVTAGGSITTVSTAGSYPYTLSCLTATSLFKTTVTPSIAAGSGDISSSELTNLGLAAYPSNISVASSTYTCTTGNSINNGSLTTQVVFLTGGTSFTVPSTWNSADNSIEVIGGGGGGSTALITSAPGGPGPGGGGGAYSKIINVILAPSSIVGISVGGPGDISTAGTDTFFCSLASNCASMLGTAVIVGAKGGAGGPSGSFGVYQPGGAGGAANSGFGATKYSGGAGGDGGGGGNGGGGGGGAAGPNGPGGAGGGNDGQETSQGGGSGGGNGGGGRGTEICPESDGCAGGNNAVGSGAGAQVAAGVAGNAGTNGGGGSGGGGNSTSNAPPPAPGGAGGAGAEWTTRGSGGGGGGGGGQACPFIFGAAAGSGGSYGGGGAGGGYSCGTKGSGAVGAGGLIVITFLP